MREKSWGERVWIGGVSGKRDERRKRKKERRKEKKKKEKNNNNNNKGKILYCEEWELGKKNGRRKMR